MATSRSGLPYEGLWQRFVHHSRQPLAEAASLCSAFPAVPRRKDFCLAYGGESCLPCVVTRTAVRPSGIHVKRDSWVSVMYAEELNSTTSSVTLQRTDRHGSMGQKSADFQLSL